MKRKLFWQSLVFAFVLIGAFIALDMTGVTRGVPQIVTTATMAVIALVFVLVMDKRQRKS